MAVVGDKLTNPESGWQRINDSNVNIKYSGNVTYYTNQSGYLSDNHAIKSNGLCRLFFYGTKIRLIGTNYNTKSKDVQISIDNEINSFSSNLINNGDSTVAFNYLLFEKKDLEKTVHEIKIYLKDEDTSNFELDAIDIDEDGYMVYCDDNDKLYYDVTPIMTSNNTPSPYAVTSSTVYSTNYQSFYAFDGNKRGDGTSFAPNSNVGWICLDFGEKTKISSFIIGTGEGTYFGKEAYPINFELLGSNDGSSFELIKVFSNIMGWIELENRMFNLANTMNYRYYKINVTQIGNASYLNIAELRYLLAVDTPFFLLNDNGAIKNYNEDTNTLVDVTDTVILNANALENTCIYDLNKAKDLIDLNSVEILCNQNVSLNIDGTKSNKEMIISTQNLSISSAEQINTFKQIISQVNNGNVKTVFSLDNATTWKTWDSTSLSFIDLTNTVNLTNLDVKNMTTEQQIQWNTLRDEINEKGMDKTTIQTLDFNSLFDETHKNIRFAHVLIRPTYEDTVTLQNMTWNINKKGLWHKLSENDIDIAIDLKHCEVKALNKDMNNVKVNILI